MSLSNLYAPSSDYCLRPILLGDSSVGKSSLLTRFASKFFSGKYRPSIGLDFVLVTQTSKSLEVAGKKVKLMVWDSAGGEKGDLEVALDGFVVVYDCTLRSSFGSVRTWVHHAKKSVRDAPIVIVGNKCDLESQKTVSFEEGKALADELNLKFLETSAKTGANLELVFSVITAEMIAEVVSRTERFAEERARLRPGDVEVLEWVRKAKMAIGKAGCAIS